MFSVIGSRAEASIDFAEQIFSARNRGAGTVTAKERDQAVFEAAGTSVLSSYFLQTREPVTSNTQAMPAVEGGWQGPLMRGIRGKRLLVSLKRIGEPVLFETNSPTSSQQVTSSGSCSAPLANIATARS